MDISTICVCGAGTMGSGIAQVAATGGFQTILYEVNEAVLDKAKSSIAASLKKLAEKGKIKQEDVDNIFNKINFTSDFQQCKADVIIEAIVEKREIKISLFNKLADINAADTIFASNTSSLSLTNIAEEIKNPERVVGMHFFNPAPLMKLVEIIKAEKTDDSVIKKLVGLTKKLNKTPVVCKDAPGFIVNRVARPFYIEALRLAEENASDFKTIDTLLEAKGFKMGPFKLMDLIGNDINYAVSCSLYTQLQEPQRLKPSYLQKEKVDKGELGKKSGKGYYEY